MRRFLNFGDSKRYLFGAWIGAMHLEKLYLLACFVAIWPCSKEMTTEDLSSSETPQAMERTQRENATVPISKKINTKILEDGKRNFSANLNSKEVVLALGEQRRNFSRWNYSLILPETTPFDDWWYPPTKRPIFYKDFPGRLGVATWREIPLGRQGSHKMKTPTAEAISSATWTLKAPVQWAAILLKAFCVTFLFHSF